MHCLVIVNVVVVIVFYVHLQRRTQFFLITFLFDFFHQWMTKLKMNQEKIKIKTKFKRSITCLKVVSIFWGCPFDFLNELFQVINRLSLEVASLIGM